MNEKVQIRLHPSTFQKLEREAQELGIDVKQYIGDLAAQLLTETHRDRFPDREVGGEEQIKVADYSTWYIEWHDYPDHMLPVEDEKKPDQGPLVYDQPWPPY